jgi:ABC-type lipoprotein release transport system permease subunit
LNITGFARQVRRNITKSKYRLASGAFGLALGTATLSFFLALSFGIRDKVLGRIYPSNQIEFEVEKVPVFGLGIKVASRIDEPVLSAIKSLDGVSGVYPKQASKFQAKLWGGREIFGYRANLEAFFDGMQEDLVSMELRSQEEANLGPENLRIPCSKDSECPRGASCKDSFCHRNTYYDKFRDLGILLPCQNDSDCVEGERCMNHRCATPCEACTPAEVCVSGECLRRCERPSDCAPSQECKSFPQGYACATIPCSISDPAQQLYDEPPKSLPPCPSGTYCAIKGVFSKEGFCEEKIPVLLSPFILDVYNSVAATAYGLPRLSGPEVGLGLSFSILFGESFFVEDESAYKRFVKRARVVGFSSKALDFGVTMPLKVVERLNAFYRGKQSALEFTSVVVETTKADAVPALIQDLKVLGLVPTAKSEERRKAMGALAVLTILFLALSLFILVISSLNISHTFMTLVHERRQEIAIYRAVGATFLAIRALLLAEAGIIGIAGGGVGVLVGFLLSRLFVFGMQQTVGGMFSVNMDIFSFDFSVIVLGILASFVFALLGALVPSSVAGKTDPVKVLSQS